MADSTRRQRTLWQSLTDALAGLAYAVRTQRNMRRLVALGALLLLGGVARRVSPLEFLVLVGAVAVMLFEEMVNTAMEVLADHFSGGVHQPQIKWVKDLAAGAVLITAASAMIVGLVVLL